MALREDELPAADVPTTAAHDTSDPASPLLQLDVTGTSLDSHSKTSFQAPHLPSAMSEAVGAELNLAVVREPGRDIGLNFTKNVGGKQLPTARAPPGSPPGTGSAPRSPT